MIESRAWGLKASGCFGTVSLDSFRNPRSTPMETLRDRMEADLTIGG